MFVFMRNVQDITHFPIDGDTTAREDLLQRVPFMQAASLTDQRRNVYANEISEQTRNMHEFVQKKVKQRFVSK